MKMNEETKMNEDYCRSQQLALGNVVEEAREQGRGDSKGDKGAVLEE
jgi:hypothetical protein